MNLEIQKGWTWLSRFIRTLADFPPKKYEVLTPDDSLQEDISTELNEKDLSIIRLKLDKDCDAYSPVDKHSWYDDYGNLSFICQAWLGECSEVFREYVTEEEEAHPGRIWAIADYPKDFPEEITIFVSTKPVPIAKYEEYVLEELDGGLLDMYDSMKDMLMDLLGVGVDDLHGSSVWFKVVVNG